MPLYKYVKPDLIKILQNISVRFSPLSEFNDPFELLPDTTIVEKPQFYELWKECCIPKFRVSHPNLSNEEIEHKARRVFEANIKMRKREILKELLAFRPARIFCLSKIAPSTSKAILLWAHYAENHAGMVLEFDGDNSWIQAHRYKKGQPRLFEDVQYRPKRLGWVELEPMDEFLYTKSEHWIYEEEVRLIRFVGDKDFDAIKIDALVKFPPEMLLSVTLGVNNTQEHEVRDALNKIPEFRHVTLFKAELHTDEYKVTLKKLSR